MSALFDLQGECGITAVGLEAEHLADQYGLDVERTAEPPGEYAQDLGFHAIAAA